MPPPSDDAHNTFQRLLFRDTLDTLFRCGDCGACLVGAIPSGLVRDGRLSDVRCPQCKTVWTFLRLPSLSTEQDRLTKKDLHTLQDQVPGHFIDPPPSPTHCDRCGRELTDPKSIARGMGPDCWAALGAHRRN